MRNFILHHRDKWGTWTAVWWGSFITFGVICAHAGASTSDLFVPMIQGAAVGLILIAIYAYSQFKIK